MQLARVVGNLVSTRKADKLDGMKILVAVPIDMDTFEETGAPFVTIDAIGAGEGEVVMCVGGSSSRQTYLTEGTPVDNTIVAIIDCVDLQGKRVFDKAQDYSEKPKAVEPPKKETKQPQEAAQKELVAVKQEQKVQKPVAQAQEKPQQKQPQAEKRKPQNMMSPPAMAQETTEAAKPETEKKENGNQAANKPQDTRPKYERVTGSRKERKKRK